MVYDYVGGSIAHIQKVIRRIEMRQGSLEEVLNQLLRETKGEIKFTFIELYKQDLLNKPKILEVFQSILDNGYFNFEKADKETIVMIEFFCEKEILFFEIVDNYIYSNSRIYEKAMIEILNQQ
jgi:hypothetical protein